MRERKITILFASLCALAFMGCDGGTPEVPDTGIILPDGGPFVGPGTCAASRVVNGELGTIRLDLDTTDDPPGLLDLGPMCGNPDAAPGPQEVIAYQVPGTGPIGVRIDTALGDTLTNLDTTVQVRRTCGEIPAAGFPPTCFDDLSDTDPRAAGAVMAEGGETLYIVVTGFADPLEPGVLDRGPLSIEISAEANAPPEILSGEVRTVAERTEIALSGRDPDENVLGVLARFFTSDGSGIDVNSDGSTEDPIGMGFDAPTSGVEFSATSTILFIRVGAGGAALSERLATLRAATAELVIVDDYFAESAPMSVPVRFLGEVGLGADCSASSDMGCTLGLRCVTDRCEATPEMAALCESATALSLTTPTTSTTSVTYAGAMPGGFGLIESSCAHSPGQEAVFDVDVPAGDFDLIARTDMPGSGATDTVLYIRTACADRLSEPAQGCHDNIGPSRQSRVVLENAAEGTYTVFVEKQGHPSDDPTPYEVEVSLRPVLATGADCDPAGELNRCGAGACPTASPVCP